MLDILCSMSLHVFPNVCSPISMSMPQASNALVLFVVNACTSFAQSRPASKADEEVRAGTINLHTERKRTYLCEPIAGNVVTSAKFD